MLTTRGAGAFPPGVRDAMKRSTSKVTGGSKCLLAQLGDELRLRTARRVINTNTSKGSAALLWRLSLQYTMLASSLWCHKRYYCTNAACTSAVDPACLQTASKWAARTHVCP